MSHVRASTLSLSEIAALLHPHRRADLSLVRGAVALGATIE
jgi:hypothetical protein